MKRLFIISAAIPALLLMNSCNHKDLIYESAPQPVLKVVFDWRNAPDADPESMGLYLYDGQQAEPLRFIFTDRYGGWTKIPYGGYKALCVNSDITDWAIMRNEGDIESFEILTADASLLTGAHISSRSIPKAKEVADERMAATPEMLWSSRDDAVIVPRDVMEKTIVMYPEENVCHYTVDIYDVSHMDYLSGSAVDATISGMAESYLQGKRTPSDTHVTMPFLLTEGSGSNSLHGEFLTFGESPVTANKHIMTVYMFLIDGTKWYYTFDVTDQVHEAPDPRHVHIILKGLDLPKPMSTGGGLRPDVNDWQTESVDIKM